MSGANLSSTIDWGDGTTSAGVVNSDASFIDGTHTYASAGQFNASATLKTNANVGPTVPFVVVVTN